MSYTLKDNYESGASPRLINSGDRTYMAWSWTAGSSYTLNKVNLDMDKVGSAWTYTMELLIYSDNGSGGANTLLATSVGSVNVADLPTSKSFTVSEWLFIGLSLTSGTKYHGVLKQSNESATDYPRLYYGTVSGQKTENDIDGVAPFTQLAADTQFNFRTYQEDITCAVTYDGNSNTGGTVPTDGSSPYAQNATVTVLGNTGSLVKTGYTFIGWNTISDLSGTSYLTSDTFTITANTILYAIWATSDPVTISFGGAVVVREKFLITTQGVAYSLIGF